MTCSGVKPRYSALRRSAPRSDPSRDNIETNSALLDVASWTSERSLSLLCARGGRGLG